MKIRKPWEHILVMLLIPKVFLLGTLHLGGLGNAHTLTSLRFGPRHDPRCGLDNYGWKLMHSNIFKENSMETMFFPTFCNEMHPKG